VFSNLHVTDSTGITYYSSNAAKDMTKPLGFVDAKAILSTCELGVKKKQDFCVEVATPERNWIFWALDQDSMKSWINAFEAAKAAGLAAKGGGSVAVLLEKEKKGLAMRLSSKKEEEDIDYISSEEEEDNSSKKVTPGKKTFGEQSYTTQIEVIKQ
jgi:hypothetical protein